MKISKGRAVRRVYSNFNDTIIAIMTGFERIPGAFGAVKQYTKAGTFGPDLPQRRK